MKTLLIYDNTGYIYVQITSSYRVPEGGLQFLEIEIPEGQILKGVDVSVTPNVPIFEEIPKTEVESMQEQLLATQAELANLKEQVLLNK
jgi:outer membrane protein assembly factor BamA